MEIPILFIDKKDCCGCGACFFLCPKKAIIMKYDEEGFAYPFIESSRCIRCRKCLKVCLFKGYKKNGE